MNGHGPVDLAKYLPGATPPQDPRFSRVKIVPVDLPVIVGFLSLDGSAVLKCEGMPLGAEVLGWNLRRAMTPNGQQIDQLVLILHHPDFPVVLGNEPPVININISARRLEAPDGSNQEDRQV